MSEFGKRHQEELLNRQEELQQAHNQLAENSNTILKAQVLLINPFSLTYNSRNYISEFVGSIRVEASRNDEGLRQAVHPTQRNADRIKINQGLHYVFTLDACAIHVHQHETNLQRSTKALPR